MPLRMEKPAVDRRVFLCACENPDAPASYMDFQATGLRHAPLTKSFHKQGKE
jgi:hypothetical protein